MATTPKTVRTYPINSVARDFPIPFEYLARKFVVVTLIGVTRRELTLNTDYRFSTATTITTTRAWGPADGFNFIEIRRLTSATERLVDFADGSILRAYDLNTSQVQSLHIAEEARDLTADTIGVNNDGNLDARARRIVNVADAIEDGDAVNLRMQKTWAGSALNQAQAAANSAQQSLQYGQYALARAQEAQSFAQSAAQSDAQATSQRNEATRQAGLAAGSATNARNSEVAASQWAAAPEDQLVSGGSYSSLHYSRKSAASAQASGQYSVNAQGSAGQAAQSVVAAQAQADRAKTEADKLANFNGLAGAIDAVNGTTVTWKGELRTKGYGFRSMNDVEANFAFTKADGTDVIRWVRTSDRAVQLYDDSQGQRAYFGPNGTSFPKTLSVAGTFTAQGNFSGAGGNFSGGLGVGSLTSSAGVEARVQFVVKPPAGDPNSNVHVWWRNTNDTERGLIYVDSANTMRIRTAAGNGDGNGLMIDGRNFPTAYGLNVSHRPDYQTTFFKSGVGANASMYGNCQLQLQAGDGGIPALGFHSAGRYAAALWLNSDNNFYIYKNGGQNELLISNATLMGQIAGNMTADVMGGLAFLSNSAGLVGPNGAVAGGSLRWSSHNSVLAQTVSGMWRCLGYGNTNGSTLWVRYA
uniref:Tail fiber protein n=1 Tax=Pseudomonas phage Ghuch01 TaxID=3138535 RepID=A0AAU6W497_9CAUD